MARSGRTWRTGVSVAAASRSRHAASAWATERGLRAQRLGVLQLEPGDVGVGGPRRPGAQLLAGLLGPPEPAQRRQLGDQPVVQLEQRRHVGGGVRLLGVGQRAPQPVGQAVALGRRDAQLALQQRDQRRRAVADEPGGDLGVEQVRAGWRRTACVRTSRSCWAAWATASAGLSNSRRSGAGSHAVRVDEHDPVGPAQLHQREAREVRPLAVELGVDGVAGFGDEDVDDLVELGGLIDPAMGHEGWSPRDHLAPGRDPRRRSRPRR